MKHIHIIAPFQFANGGDWSAIDLYLALREQQQEDSPAALPHPLPAERPQEVLLWSTHPPHQDLAAYPIRQIQAYRNALPDGGILIISGALTEIGHWYDQVSYSRVIVIHNLFASQWLFRLLHRLRQHGRSPVDIVYASAMLKQAVGLAGEIWHPKPHPQRFQPLPRTPKAKDAPFVLGHVSGDNLSKHHPEDIRLYQSLAAAGIHVRVVGGTCLQPWLANTPGVELLPAVAQSAMPAILASMDAFYYRPLGLIREAFGLTVAEAMLAGLPVVVWHQGGYTEVIEHGKNGWLFEQTEQAQQHIMTLAECYEAARQ